MILTASIEAGTTINMGHPDHELLELDRNTEPFAAVEARSDALPPRSVFEIPLHGLAQTCSQNCSEASSPGRAKSWSRPSHSARHVRVGRRQKLSVARAGQSRRLERVHRLIYRSTSRPRRLSIRYCLRYCSFRPERLAVRLAKVLRHDRQRATSREYSRRYHRPELADLQGVDDRQRNKLFREMKRAVIVRTIGRHDGRP